MIPPLCFVTDADAPLPILDQAECAVRGGAGWVQLRHKTLDDMAFADLARALRERIAPLGGRLVLNDRVAVARALGVFGLHVGQSDGDPATIRSQISPDMVLGLSIEDESQVAAIPRGVDYLGVGPVRATKSKADHAPPLGFDGLSRIASATDLPCMAIGGLSVADVPAIRAAGCTGLAVVSAISRAADPEAAARTIATAWSAP